MEALYQFLNTQSDGRLVLYALVFCAVVSIVTKMIADIVKHLTSKKNETK